MQGANCLAFDIAGDLALGAPFGMLEAAKDIPADVTKWYSTGKVSEVIEILL